MSSETNGTPCDTTKAEYGPAALNIRFTSMDGRLPDVIGLVKSMPAYLHDALQLGTPVVIPDHIVDLGSSIFGNASVASRYERITIHRYLMGVHEKYEKIDATANILLDRKREANGLESSRFFCMEFSTGKWSIGKLVAGGDKIHTLFSSDQL